MASSLIHGKYVICQVISRTEAEVIENGAVFQRDGTIIDIGPYQELAAKYQPDEVLGSDGHVIMPGFVNSHHHVGLTPLQLGSPDYPLELWFASRMAARDVPPYLDTLYSAFEMLESGITTVQHLHGWRVRPISRVSAIAEQILKAYQDIGMRVSYSYVLRLHRIPGMEDVVPTAAQVFQMATENGALTTGFGATIGMLKPGRAADLVLVNWQQIAYPYLDAGLPVVDAVVQRAKTSGVETVLVAGEPVLRDGQFTRVNKAEMLAALAEAMRAPLQPAEESRRALSPAVFPYIRQFYEGWLDESARDPFYRPHARR
jgi:cytosine/adenosine deaminase-related metal-dependent hydrolase